MSKRPSAVAENSAITARRGNPEKIIPHRWQKGCASPNPGGRPKTAALSQACREVLAQPVPKDPRGRTYAEAIAQMLAQRALGGDIRAAQEIADRAEGKPRQSLDVDSAPKSISIEVINIAEVDALAVTQTDGRATAARTVDIAPATLTSNNPTANSLSGDSRQPPFYLPRQ